MNKINISGNKKTKQKIIFRELVIAPGDTIQLSELANILEKCRRNLLNTRLFNQVTTNVKNWNLDSQTADIEIEVQEAWYLFPAPIFELADRNFNVWWVEQKRSLQRINLGLRVKYLNPTGNGDELKLKVHGGYTRKAEIRYTYPYINKGQTLGAFGSVLFSQNKEIGYQLNQNKIEFLKRDELILFDKLRLETGLIIRPNIYNQHIFRFGYNRHRIHELVSQEYNENFFGSGHHKQRYYLMEYEYRNDHRDLSVYPRHGYFVNFRLKRIGLLPTDDLKNWVTRFEYDHYTLLGRRSSFGFSFTGQTTLTPNKLPFYSSKAIGFGDDYLRGYEYFVINGERFLMLKTKIKLNIISKEFNIGKWMPIKALKNLPLEVFVTGGTDLGIVHDPIKQSGNELANQVLRGITLGLDVLLYNNYLYTAELSYNHFQELGLFLHYNVRF